MEIVDVIGQARADLGKKGSKDIRNQGLIPCVLYGGGEVLHFSVVPNDIRPLIYTPDFKLASITIDGQPHRAIVKDVQFHPLNDEILHIDFLHLVEGHPIKVELPVRFRGTSPGVKIGGRLVQQLRRVKVKTTPDKLISELTLDISTLKMGQSIRVRDIDATEGIEIMNQPGIPVASVEVPRALRSAAAAAEKEGGAGDEDEGEETE